MARHLVVLVVLAGAGLFLTGCVSGEKYNALKMEKDAAVEQLQKAQADASAARAEAAAWKQQHDALLANGSDLQKMYGLSQKELAELRSQLDQMTQKYNDAVARGANTQVVTLPIELQNELEKLAQQYPGVVEFDKARGILKFKSDVTFASGSAELTPQAKQAISAFAKILNSPVAANYELLISGHTDNRPVNNPATKAQHKDNWYLSAHRAISVSQGLMSDGVNARRIGAAGFGAERPIASNNTTEGMAKNRRVEVAILPTTYKGGASLAGGDALKVTPKKATPKPEINKDTASTGTEPIINK